MCLSSRACARDRLASVEAMRSLRSRLTYANVVATLAVFLALGGGTAVAASLINGRRLVNRSVGGAKLKNNGVSGRQVRESSLGTVPRAKNANNATRLAGIPAPGFLRATGKAADADRLDGADSSQFVRGTGVNVVRRGAVVPARDASAFSTVATLDGLGTVAVACFNGGRDVTLRYTSTTQARQFVADHHSASTGGQVTEGATLLAGAGRDIGASDLAATPDYALTGRLTTVRDAPDGDSAEIDYSAVMLPAGEGRCAVSLVATSG